MSADGTIYKTSIEFFNDTSSNFGIIHVIKAADQLYYKDKTLYTTIKPELIRSETNQPNYELKQKSGKDEMNDNSGKIAAGNLKENHVQKEKSGANKSSKLQEIIGQAKKTVEDALCSSQGSLECQQNSMDLRREVAKINAKSDELVNLLNTLEQRLKAVEELTEGIARKIGYSN